jgi:YaiO family outer membrane protein
MKPHVLLAILVFGLSLAPPISLLAQDQDKEAAAEKASQAIRAGDYAGAVGVCLEQLQSNPADYELNFQLSRAYAFSGHQDDSLAILNKLADAHPGNADVLLFRARVEAWKKDYRAAEDGYQEVLAVDPGNTEALTGLAEVASWQGDYEKAILFYGQISERHPEEADIHFRLGRVHLWDGNTTLARENFRQAHDLDPSNPEYLRALKTASPRWQDKFELRYEQQNESFSDGREDYVDRRLALQLKLGRAGPLVLKANTTERFAKKDYQYEIEFYPRLWRRAYADVDAAYSPQAVHYPESMYLCEIYQGISSSWDVSLGYRRLNFAPEQVDVYLGSLGCYLGKYYSFFRWYHTPGAAGETFSWTFNLRRYFGDSSYVYGAYGRGSRPFDISTVEDLRLRQSWILSAGFDWYLIRHLKLQLNYTYREEEGLRRNLLYIGTGYRW